MNYAVICYSSSPCKPVCDENQNNESIVVIPGAQRLKTLDNRDELVKSLIDAHSEDCLVSEIPEKIYKRIAALNSQKSREYLLYACQQIYSNHNKPVALHSKVIEHCIEKSDRTAVRAILNDRSLFSRTAEERHISARHYCFADGHRISPYHSVSVLDRNSDIESRKSLEESDLTDVMRAKIIRGSAGLLGIGSGFGGAGLVRVGVYGVKVVSRFRCQTVIVCLMQVNVVARVREAIDKFEHLPALRSAVKRFDRIADEDARRVILDTDRSQCEDAKLSIENDFREFAAISESMSGDARIKTQDGRAYLSGIGLSKAVRRKLLKHNGEPCDEIDLVACFWQIFGLITLVARKRAGLPTEQTEEFLRLAGSGDLYEILSADPDHVEKKVVQREAMFGAALHGYANEFLRDHFPDVHATIGAAHRRFGHKRNGKKIGLFAILAKIERALIDPTVLTLGKSEFPFARYHDGFTLSRRLTAQAVESLQETSEKLFGWRIAVSTIRFENDVATKTVIPGGPSNYVPELLFGFDWALPVAESWIANQEPIRTVVDVPQHSDTKTVFVSKSEPVPSVETGAVTAENASVIRSADFDEFASRYGTVVNEFECDPF